MTRDDQGIWSVTVGPLAEQLWGYSFNVDGLKVLDPGNGEYQRDGQRYDRRLKAEPGLAQAVRLSLASGLAATLLSLLRFDYVWTPTFNDTTHGGDTWERAKRGVKKSLRSNLKY